MTLDFGSASVRLSVPQLITRPGAVPTLSIAQGLFDPRGWGGNLLTPYPTLMLDKWPGLSGICTNTQSSGEKGRVLSRKEGPQQSPPECTVARRVLSPPEKCSVTPAGPRGWNYGNQNPHLHLHPKPIRCVGMKPLKIAMDTGFDNNTWVKVVLLSER